MPRKEIQKYEILPYLSSSNDIEIPPQEQSTLDCSIVLDNVTAGDMAIIDRIGNYGLSRILILTVSYEEGIAFVESQEFNIWGEGSTLDQAIDSFKDFFLYDLESYLDTPIDEMDFFARQTRALYKDLVNIL